MYILFVAKLKVGEQSYLEGAGRCRVRLSPRAINLSFCEIWNDSFPPLLLLDPLKNKCSRVWGSMTSFIVVLSTKKEGLSSCSLIVIQSLGERVEIRAFQHEKQSSNRI